MERANFGSKIGVILATVGSAVGLGNVWRFPYMTGENGGAVFILIYLGCVLFLGIPCMISEFIIGRHAHANTARAYSTLSDGRGWGFVGYIAVAIGFLTTSYYVVISGWCLQYIFASATGQLTGDPGYVKEYFATFSQHPVRPIVWTLLILLMAHLVIVRGVRGGIEKASKVMMPVLFILLLIIIVAACSLPGSMAGVEFLFKPDFSKVSSGVFLGALGQSFYSLSLGMGCVCTYASYFSRQTNLTRSAVQIALLDSLVAILAGLMIFPAAFSVGVNPDSGPSLIFITLPNVFSQAFAMMPAAGYVVSLIFYVLLSMAALTSLISLHEVSTAFVHEELHMTRTQAATVVSLMVALIGACCSLSMGGYEALTFFGYPLLDSLDYLSAQIVLPLGGFLTCIFIGWFAPHKVVRDEFTNWGRLHGRFFHAYLFCIKFVCPIAIILIFLHQFGLI